MMADNDPNEDRECFSILLVVFLFSLHKCIKELFIASGAVSRKKVTYIFDLQWFGTIILTLTLPFTTSLASHVLPRKH